MLRLLRALGIILLFLAAPAAADDVLRQPCPFQIARMAPILFGGSGGQAGTTYCSACPDTNNGGNELCEVWDSSADGVCGWTIAETQCAVDTAAAPATALGCTNIQTQYVYDSNKTNTASASCGAAKDEGTGYTSGKLYVQFYVQIVSESLADAQEWVLWGMTDTGQTGNSAVNCRIYQEAGTGLKFGCSWHTGGGWQSVLSANTISTGQWYGIRVRIDMDASPDTVDWWIDYGNNGTWTQQTGMSGDRDRTMRWHRIGSGSTAIPMRWQMVGLKIDTAAMPNACDR